MGKKVKVGKARKDKYYHLAKETGLRSRAAFKLLQLNRKFQFLEKCRVCVDLCAAPGGWLQVAQQNMPMSSIIIGVDLVPIKPLHNVVTFQEDITTDKCRQTLKKELHTWKADAVLHDGAPNVGMNWIYDAFQQAQLTLQALKLATEFLKKGGWFVTKVFRSKDYQALIWVFKQLFRSVHATKPQASRNESAEIFVVCEHYKAPDKLDPKFLDVKYVFKDVNVDPKQTLNLMHPEKRKKKAEGYDENDTSFYHKLQASKFLESDSHLELLADTHEIVLDTAEIREHKLSTSELKECCKDIKVLGKKEIRSILNWRKNLKKDLDAEDPDTNAEKEEDNKDDSEAEEAELARKIETLQEEQVHEKKIKKKKVMKEKRKLRDKMELKMIHPGDHIEETDDVDLFNLKQIKKREGLVTVEKQEMMDGDSDASDMSDTNKKYYMAYDRHKEEFGDGDEQATDSEEEKEEEDDVEEEMEFEDDDVDEKDKNPLVVDLESKDIRVKRKMDMWFNKDMFSGIEEDADEDLEIDKMTEDYRKRGGVVIEKKAEKSKKRKLQKDSENEKNINKKTKKSVQTNTAEMEKYSDDSDSDNSDSDYDVHGSLQRTLLERKRGDKLNNKTNKTKGGKDGFEIVPANEPSKKVLKLDPVELAIGEEMIKSSKRRRELEEMSYNRYTHGDEDLPDWFAKDEHRHSKKQLPVTKEQVAEYKLRMKAIDARPIKKVAEAKARKKRKETKKLERVRKKAESVSDGVEMSDGEKWKQIKELYKKAGLLKQKKREVTYVVAKKGGGKKTVRPAGVKGFYKQVDPRMKKDMTGTKGGKKERGGKGSKGKGKGKGKGKTRR